MSYEPETPINSLPRHVAMLEEPMRAAGYDLPMLNTESGIGFVSRERNRMVSQAEINARDEADPAFNPAQPWLLGKNWREVSERRAAASYVTGTMMLMANNVKKGSVPRIAMF